MSGQTIGRMEGLQAAQKYLLDQASLSFVSNRDPEAKMLRTIAQGLDALIEEERKNLSPKQSRG